MEFLLLTVAYLVSSVLFILSLRGLSSQETARKGNVFGIIGMAIAVVAFAEVERLATSERIAALPVGLGAAAAIYVLPEALGWPEFSRAQLARLDSHAPTRQMPKPS